MSHSDMLENLPTSDKHKALETAITEYDSNPSLERKLDEVVEWCPTKKVNVSAYAGLNLQETKIKFKTLCAEYYDMERLIQEKKKNMDIAVKAMWSKCRHPAECIVTERMYGERSRECTRCGYEF
jgi:hypothetical protein